jgi:hypothetical protein
MNNAFDFVAYVQSPFEGSKITLHFSESWWDEKIKAYKGETIPSFAEGLLGLSPLEPVYHNMPLPSETCYTRPDTLAKAVLNQRWWRNKTSIDAAASLLKGLTPDMTPHVLEVPDYGQVHYFAGYSEEGEVYTFFEKR